jgi:alkaline phosphatase D
MLRVLFISFILLSVRVFAQTQYPDNIYADTAYAPFYYGVASGDPLQDRVIIWTKVYVKDTNAQSVPLKWSAADDSTFNTIINRGEAAARKDQDYTVHADVTGLKAGHEYFYRFLTLDGKYSQIGRCKTLPDDSVKHFKLAIVSCSSVWSGYFNAYRRIADRSDIDYVVHLGDYAYDYVDREEQRRVPVPYPTQAKNLNDWRERNTYYLLDPDLRAARQNKTWIAEWDNHDNNGDRVGAEKAFYEYQCVRLADTTHPEQIYRSFHFGELADLDMIDMFLFRGQEQYAPGKGSVLGLRQDAWFKDQLRQSHATWKLIGNQEMMGSWLSEGLPKFFHAPGNGKYFDPGNWDEFPEDRNRLYDFIDSNHINNFVALTGDAHMSFIINLTKNPKDKATFHKHTGEGAVGVEMLGPSISRGNMSDRKRIPKAFIPLIQTISRHINPHHRWVNFAKHGYCTLDVTHERCIGEFWYSPILYRSDKEYFGKGFTVKNGANHWEHKMNRSVRRSTYPKMNK